MIPDAINVVFVAALMFVGAWLEGIGGKDGFWDSFLTPLPLGLSGLVIMALERV